MRNNTTGAADVEMAPTLYPSSQGEGRRLPPGVATLGLKANLAPIHPSPAERGEGQGWGRFNRNRLGCDGLGRDARKSGPPQRAKAGFGALALILLPLAAHAVTPGEILPDPAMEARARAITSELRCLVCQNQSVDDSDASLAKDLRVLVRDKLKEGMSDAQVKEYVHSRYGDFVMLRPPVRIGTLLLWTAPLVALLAGAAAIWSNARRHGAGALSAPPEWTQEEQRRLDAIRASQREGS